MKSCGHTPNVIYQGHSKDWNQLSVRSSACGCAHDDTSAKNQSLNNLGWKRSLRSSSTIKPALSSPPLKPHPYLPHLHIFLIHSGTINRRIPDSITATCPPYRSVKEILLCHESFLPGTQTSTSMSLSAEQLADSTNLIKLLSFFQFI